MITIDGGTGKIMHNGVNVAPEIVYDVWQLNTTSVGDDAIIAGSLWTRSSTTNTNKSGAHTNVGSAMSVDSTGYWTFPSAGKWEVCFSCYWQSLSGTATRYNESFIYFTQNNSDYGFVSRPAGAVHSDSAGVYNTFQNTALLDVVDTSTHKCYFRVDFEENDSCRLYGSTEFMGTYVSFKRISDT